MLAPCPATQVSRESPPLPPVLTLGGRRAPLCPGTSPPTRCPDGSASDASRGSLGTAGIPGSGEVGYKCCDGFTIPCCHQDTSSVTEDATGPGWELVPHPAWHRASWTRMYGYTWRTCLPRTQTGMCTPPALQHHQDTAGRLPGHCCHAALCLNQQHVLRIWPALGTVPGTHQAELWPVGAGHGPSGWAEQAAEDTNWLLCRGTIL